MRHVPILGESTPAAELGEEWVEAKCQGRELETGGHEDCDRSWSARGTLNSRQALKRAQKHADRTGHRVDVQHANAR